MTTYPDKQFSSVYEWKKYIRQELKNIEQDKVLDSLVHNELIKQPVVYHRHTRIKK